MWKSEDDTEGVDDGEGSGEICSSLINFETLPKKCLGGTVLVSMREGTNFFVLSEMKLVRATASSSSLPSSRPTKVQRKRKPERLQGYNDGYTHQKVNTISKRKSIR